MPRRLRVSAGGLCFHVLHRAVGRRLVFDGDAGPVVLEAIVARAR